MTYPEVVDEINAFYRRKKNEFREQEQLIAKMDYQLAQLIGAAFTSSFPKTLKAAYPDLFKETSEGWRESKSQWQKYAEEFNRQREAKHK
jgi:hypothetical protein